MGFSGLGRRKKFLNVILYFYVLLRFWVCLGVFVHLIGSYWHVCRVQVGRRALHAPSGRLVRLQRLLSLAVAFAMKFAINNGGCA